MFGCKLWMWALLFLSGICALVAYLAFKPHPDNLHCYVVVGGVMTMGTCQAIAFSYWTSLCDTRERYTLLLCAIVHET